MIKMILDYLNRETGTKKKLALLDFATDSSQYTDSRDFSTSNVITTTDSRSWSNQTSEVYNPIDNRSLNLVLYSAGATLSTNKKLIGSKLGQTNTPTSSVIPSLKLDKTLSNLQSLTNGLDLQKIGLIAGGLFGAYLILKKTPIGKKILGGKKR